MCFVPLPAMKMWKWFRSHSMSTNLFYETVRKDQIVTPTCFVETKGESSGLFKKYRLGRGFTNYLLDENGVIIAKNISAAELSAYLN